MQLKLNILVAVSAVGVVNTAPAADQVERWTPHGVSSELFESHAAFDPKTGDEIYMQRAAAGGKYYASPVAANGHIYFTSLEDGVVTVLKAGADKPVVVAKNPPLGERVAATPAIADNTLYIRTEKHLYAFGEEK